MRGLELPMTGAAEVTLFCATDVAYGRQCQKISVGLLLGAEDEGKRGRKE